MATNTEFSKEFKLDWEKFNLNNDLNQIDSGLMDCYKHLRKIETMLIYVLEGNNQFRVDALLDDLLNTDSETEKKIINGFINPLSSIDKKPQTPKKLAKYLQRQYDKYYDLKQQYLAEIVIGFHEQFQ